MAKLYVQAVPPPDLNKNTEWFMYPGVWTTYILILFFSWLMVLSIFNCTPGMGWTIVHLCHFIVTYHFFHWKKGTPFSEDQGIYNGLTWWEQIDSGKQLTRNRKFLTVVPVVLYLIASHTTDYQQPVLFLNTLAVFVLVVAKFPNMHKVRIFGINGDQLMEAEKACQETATVHRGSYSMGKWTTNFSLRWSGFAGWDGGP